MPRRASNTIRVNVVDYGRASLMLRYRDPRTGKQHSRSAGTSSRKEADRLAAVWQADINAKRWEPGERVAWAVFRDQYEKLHLASLAEKTADSYSCILNTFEKLSAPAYLDSVTSVSLSEYASRLRNLQIVSPVQKITKNRTETTIKDHLAVLHAVLGWAVGQNMLDRLPTFPKIERARKAKKRPHKGRAITDAEFAKMLASVEQVISEDRVEDVKRILWLMRLIGLRLGEALNFWWPSHPQKNHVTFAADDRPSLIFYDNAQKSHEDETIPVTREAGLWFQSTPPAERVGRVAPWLGRLGNLKLHEASRQIAAIGKHAGIVVEPRDGKFASAHDIRRLAITDWCRRFMPAVTQRLARHKSIETTMSFYACLADEVTSDLVWNQVTNQVTENTENAVRP